MICTAQIASTIVARSICGYHNRFVNMKLECVLVIIELIVPWANCLSRIRLCTADMTISDIRPCANQGVTACLTCRNGIGAKWPCFIATRDLCWSHPLMMMWPRHVTGLCKSILPMNEDSADHATKQSAQPCCNSAQLWWAACSSACTTMYHDTSELRSHIKLCVTFRSQTPCVCTV